MGYNEVAKILILTISVVTATTAISLMSQSVAAVSICAGTTCAGAGGGDGIAFNPGALAGAHASSTAQPGVTTKDGSAASAGSVLCGGKPAAGNVITGPITCAP
jgi:hypothetical protein